MGCAACSADEQRLKNWRTVGGPLPLKGCTKEHTDRCRGPCRKSRILNEDGRCDECWLKREQKERPLPGICKGCRKAKQLNKDEYCVGCWLKQGASNDAC